MPSNSPHSVAPKLLLALLLAMSFMGAAYAESHPAAGAAVRALVPSGAVDHPLVGEISGIVQSRTHPGVFWIHNDGGNAPNIFAIRQNGDILVPEPLAREGYAAGSRAEGKQLYPGVAVEDARNVDWESLSIDGDRMYLCDLGNNENARRNLAVYLLQEPDPQSDCVARTIKRIPVRYPDQAGFPPAGAWEFDCEASFVYGHKLYFLTKHRTGNLRIPVAGTRLYRLDTERPDEENPLTLVDRRSDLGGWVTDASLSPDGRTLAVLCHWPVQSVWLFESPGDDRFLSGSARRLVFQRGGQCEALTFIDQDRLLLTNEQGQLFTLEVQDFEPVGLRRDVRTPCPANP